MKFFQLQDEDLIEDFERFLKERTNEPEEPMSLDKFYSDIQKSIDDIKHGRTFSAHDLKAKIES